MTLLEMDFPMEVNEAYNNFSCAQSERGPRIRQIWEAMMRDENGHVQNAIELLQRYKNKDPEKVLAGRGSTRPCC